MHVVREEEHNAFHGMRTGMRLNVTGLWLSRGPGGVRAAGASSLPHALSSFCFYGSSLDIVSQGPVGKPKLEGKPARPARGPSPDIATLAASALHTLPAMPLLLQHAAHGVRVQPACSFFQVNLLPVSELCPYAAPPAGAAGGLVQVAAASGDGFVQSAAVLNSNPLIVKDVKTLIIPSAHLQCSCPVHWAAEQRTLPAAWQAACILVSSLGTIWLVLRLCRHITRLQCQPCAHNAAALQLWASTLPAPPASTPPCPSSTPAMSGGRCLRR